MTNFTPANEFVTDLIAGTARLLGLALITNDPVIQASSALNTVW